jgi:hypothetical protein
MEPVLTFLFNHTGTDTPSNFNGTNDPETNGWKTINPSTDKIVITGGGILGTLSVPTCASGVRDATIRPSITSYVIPQTYVEKDQMYITYAGKNTKRYVFGVYVHGTITSDLYLEAHDDSSFSTTNLEILTGTTNNSFNSCINAIRTTYSEPPWPWSGSDTGAAYLRGTEHRVALNNASTVVNKAVYYNIYIELPTDISTFHAMPVLGLRYLYT